jgi:hypothetical protein
LTTDPIPFSTKTPRTEPVIVAPDWLLTVAAPSEMTPK